MPRHLARNVLVLLTAAASASCVTVLPAPVAAPAATSAQPTKAATAELAPREWEPWPPAPSPRSAASSRREPAANDPVVRLLPKDGGWRIDELFEMVGKTTGTSFLYDGNNATFKQAKIEFTGVHEIRESELFDWLQAVLSYRKLVLVPVGPKTPGTNRQQWMVMDQADPSMKSRPTYIDESEVFDYADRDGLYVTTSLRLRDTVDPTRARNALSPLSTQTAGIGRIQDQSNFLIVSDFAPVVAAMKRMIDRINAETPPSAVRPSGAGQRP